MWRLPDSPRWLISKSKVEQAERVLQRVRTESDVSPEIRDIQQSMAKQSSGWKAELFRPSLRMPLIVGVGLSVFQQITGINTVIYYAPTIFEFAGFKTVGSAILAGAGFRNRNVVRSRAGHLPDGPHRKETFVINWSCWSDYWPSDLRCCFPVPSIIEFYWLYSHWQPDDICRFFCYWTWAGLLADDF